MTRSVLTQTAGSYAQRCADVLRVLAECDGDVERAADRLECLVTTVRGIARDSGPAPKKKGA